MSGIRLTRSPNTLRNTLGANPKCARCGLREAISRRPGAMCDPCKQYIYFLKRKGAAAGKA